MPKIRKPDQIPARLTARLDRWLERIGLRGNPFARWNAEDDFDLPSYYVDIGNFDEFFRLTMPSVIFAQRGCGKTAQKQMIAAHCRPFRADSKELAISYSYDGFEMILESVGYEINQIRPQHHVNALLRLGLAGLISESSHDSKVQGIHESAAFTALADSSNIESLGTVNRPTSVKLLQRFASLIKNAGLETCVVLVDGLDEFIYTADPALAIKFISPLLGTLPLIECPGFAFKFFLPKELESDIRSCAWFRADRLHVVPIDWSEDALLKLIEQRLVYFSRRKPEFTDLAELCDDNLRPVIDKDIVALSSKLPRNILILADKLLRFHSQQVDQTELIALPTWEQVKEWWRQDYEEKNVLVASRTDHPDSNVSNDKLSINDSGHPLLRIEEEKGQVWLGKQEIREKIQGQVYTMLLCLYRHRGEVCSKDKIVEEVWAHVTVGEGVTDQDIAAAVSRLRRILREIAPNSNYIKTIKGKTRTEGGYRLEPSGF